MGRMRVTPGERVSFDAYFATYVHQTLANSHAPGVIRHLSDFGAALLGSRQHADSIIDEALTEGG